MTITHSLKIAIVLGARYNNLFLLYILQCHLFFFILHQVNVEENRVQSRKGNIQRNRQDWTHKTQKDDKQNKKKPIIHRKIHTKPVMNPGAPEG